MNSETENRKLKIAILGAGGRMGRMIIGCIMRGSVSGIELYAAIDRNDHPDLGKDAGSLSGCDPAGIALSSGLDAADGADVVIDFSFHTSTAEHSRILAEKGKAIVIGTTGLSDDEKGMVAEAAKTVPIVTAPNMSVGMNLLFSLVEQTAAALNGKGYDLEIIERHHRKKKDSPSGTALGLGEAAARGLGSDLSKVSLHGREGHVGERTTEEIGFHAVRGGDIVGDHTVLFAGEGECIELSHRATSREAFAMGALRAAVWVEGKAPGLYSMQDVLGI